MKLAFIRLENNYSIFLLEFRTPLKERVFTQRLSSFTLFFIYLPYFSTMPALTPLLGHLLLAKFCNFFGCGATSQRNALYLRYTGDLLAL